MDFAGGLTKKIGFLGKREGKVAGESTVCRLWARQQAVRAFQ